MKAAKVSSATEETDRKTAIDTNATTGAGARADFGGFTQR